MIHNTVILLAIISGVIAGIAIFKDWKEALPLGLSIILLAVAVIVGASP